MSQSEAKPFSENALRRITQIIIKQYRDQQNEDDDFASLAGVYDTFFPGIRSVHDFFGRAGCREDFVENSGAGATNSTLWSLAKIQAKPNGRTKLIKIIEQLCDPEEYFDDPQN